jgi:sodium transport system permease protein
MKWSNVNLIFRRELRDQLRDRRTLFTVAIMPILLYPLLGMAMLQVAQFMREHPTRIWIMGSENLPSQPALLDGGEIADDWVNSKTAELIETEVLSEPTEELEKYIREFRNSDNEQARELIDQLIQKELKDRKFDAAVFITQPIDSPEATPIPANPSTETSSAEILVFVDSASDRSRIAAERIFAVLQKWKNAWTDQLLAANDVPTSINSGIVVQTSDVANKVGKRAAAWSKILPFIVMIWCLTGAFYPAIDLCAGEKERGTFETLLSSPAERSEIAIGKLLTVMSFSMATSVLNLMSMAITGIMLASKVGAMATFGTPPVHSIGWLLLALVPISALFSAVALAAAAFAQSSKEGQYYLVPLLMFSMPLMMVPMLPGSQLDLGTSLIPVSGLMLLLRHLMEGQYSFAAQYGAPVVLTTLLCCWMAIRWVVHQFNSESVLFRASERFGIGKWLGHIMRERHELPSLGNALLCGLLILVIKFFVSIAASPPSGWTAFSQQTAIILVVSVAAPALIMATMLTRNPRKSLRLRPCTVPAACAAVLAAICLNPLLMWFTALVMTIYPPGPELLALQSSVQSILDGAPSWWSILLIFAIAPAIMEELAYRGFILSGFQSLRNKWHAILLTSLLFGVAHSVLQQTVITSVAGIILGIIAVQTRSLIPCILFHATHNGLTVMMGIVPPETIQGSPLLSQILYTNDGATFQYGLVPGILMSIVGLSLIFWFLRFDHAVAHSRESRQPSRFDRWLAKMSE